MTTGPPGDDLALMRAALDDLTALLVDEETLETVLQRVVTLARDGIGECDAASITYVRHGRPETIVCTDRSAEAIDEEQYAADAGPCLEAFRTRTVVSVPSMVEHDRWNGFRRAALALGVHSSFSLPLAAGPAEVGALNLYGRREHAFNHVPPDAALLFAQQAAAAVWSARTITSIRSVIGHLETALASRDTIGMAKGIVMATAKVTADEAIRILSTASQHRNVKLRDIAADVVETGVIPASSEST